MCVRVCGVILFHLLCFEGKKNRVKQIGEKEGCLEVLLRETSFEMFCLKKRKIYKFSYKPFCLLLTVSALELWKIKEPFKRKHIIT